MMTSLSVQMIAMLAVLVLVPIALVVFIVRRRLAASIDARIHAVSPYVLHDFLLPDGNDGEIHFEYALLSHTGILVIDTKDVEGNVFGSDTMDQWTVINDNRRHTFDNPQRGLLDRVAAIKSLAPDIKVEGHIAFTDSARFSKGQPGHVIFFDTLITTLKETSKEQAEVLLNASLPSWEMVVAGATVTGVAKALRGKND
jgi:hypothetical protein